MSHISAKKVFCSGGMLENKNIRIENGIIAEIVDHVGPFDVECISAAFIDTHINGGEDLYFTKENSLEAIDDIFRASVNTGTYFVLPALITSSEENILKGIGKVKEYRHKNPNSGVLGLHLEGPFLNPIKRGAHLAKYVRMPSDAEIERIIDEGKEVIKIWTIAPEQFTKAQIEMIRSAGIRLSVGHSNATYEEAQSAFDQGINLVTHLYNAMSGLHHRQPGLVGATLANKKVWAPIIPDGKHCHFGAVKTAYAAKPEHLFIISDALFLGRKKMSFQWEEFNAKLINGEYVNSDGNLAGSAISMFEAIRNMVNEIHVPLEVAIEMATVRPAKAIGLEASVGNIAKGYPAIFSVFDQGLSKCEVLIIN